MPLDAFRHHDDPGLAEQLAAARVERRWRQAAAQRGLSELALLILLAGVIAAFITAPLLTWFLLDESRLRWLGLY